MRIYSSVAKFFLMVIMVFLIHGALKAQYVYIDYYDPQETILTSCDSLGYSFDYKNYFFAGCYSDSTTYSFISSHIDSLVYAKESDGCRFPKVSQRIVVLKSNDEYDMIFSDGVSAMEKNGRCVLFDEELQRVVNNFIEWGIAKRKKKN